MAGQLEGAGPWASNAPYAGGLVIDNAEEVVVEGEGWVGRDCALQQAEEPLPGAELSPPHRKLHQQHFGVQSVDEIRAEGGG